MAKQALGWRCSMSVKSILRTYQTAARQLVRYALIGVLTNVIGYVLYLLITYSGGTPKLTMTGMYAVGVVVSFFANRKFTFRHDGHIGAAGIRFLFAYFLGYLLNLLLLVIFVDRMGFPHQLVQAVAIVVVALFLFALLRLFVFAQRTVENGEIQP